MTSQPRGHRIYVTGVALAGRRELLRVIGAALLPPFDPRMPARQNQYAMQARTQSSETRLPSFIRTSDGAIFVADAQVSRLPADLDALTRFADLLTRAGRDPLTYPTVIALNKHDLPHICRIDDIRPAVVTSNYAIVPTIARRGEGALGALRTLIGLLG